MAIGYNDKAEDTEFEDKVIHINRCAKVVKGGRRFSFAAIVVVGNKKQARAVPHSLAPILRLHRAVPSGRGGGNDLGVPDAAAPEEEHVSHV